MQPPRRSWLYLLAVLYGAASVAYGALWMHGIRLTPTARLGVDWREYSPDNRSLTITAVAGGSAAERAGLRPGDIVVQVNGRRLPGPYLDPVLRGRPGDVVQLIIERPDHTELLTLRAELDPRPAGTPPTTAQSIASELVGAFPVPFLVVGLVVLFVRHEDRNAWLLALLFGSFVAGAPLFHMEGLLHPALRGFAVAYKIILNGLAPALFAYFFAVFPAPSPLDRRVPWVKSVLLTSAMAVTLPLGAAALAFGSSHPLLWIAASVDGPGKAVALSYTTLGFIAGLVSLIWNVWAASPEARRRTRVILWGTLAGIAPMTVLSVLSETMDREVYKFPFWVWVPSVAALFVLPISFAYAVLKHRVLDVAVLVRRSARYVLVQRGLALFTFLITATATVLLVETLYAVFAPRELALHAGLVVAVGFGLLLASAGNRIGRSITRRIDRAFFRNVYDARQILQDLSEQVRTATDRVSLANLLDRHLREALHPRSLAVYIDTVDGRLRGAAGDVPPALDALPTDLSILAEVSARGQPSDVSERSPEDLAGLADLVPDCLVPILGRSGRLAGIIALGERLSEEPYSGEDRRLLASVANQAGVALENLALAEEMAARIEAERRALQEIEIAQQVQAKLFPQRRPPLATLEYAGGCIQARAVGGDYYDFLDLGAGRLGLVLADVSGKGIAASLLMANLQANLRSQCTASVDDLPRVLALVNRLFHDATPPNRYATLFFGDYDDHTSRLRYGNCGHNPPLLLRESGTVQRLDPTGTVVGLFNEWSCSVAEVQLQRGDLLLIFSDGASEAWSDAGEEFGEARLLESLRSHRRLPVEALLDALTRDVQAFTGSEQEDDLTLIAARVR